MRLDSDVRYFRRIREIIRGKSQMRASRSGTLKEEVLMSKASMSAR